MRLGVRVRILLNNTVHKKPNNVQPTILPLQTQVEFAVTKMCFIKNSLNLLCILVNVLGRNCTIECTRNCTRKRTYMETVLESLLIYNLY